MKPTENRVVKSFAKEFAAKQELVEEFDGLLEKYEIEEPARFVLRNWVRRHLVDPVLGVAEKRLRGGQGKN